MKVSKREFIKNLKTRCYDIELEYDKKYGSIIPDYGNDTGYHLAFNDKHLDVKTEKDVMNVNFFNGKKLKDILKQVEFDFV